MKQAKGQNILDPLVLQLNRKLRECSDVVAATQDIRDAADAMYSNNDTDIEDFYDLIDVVNEYMLNQISNKDVDDRDLSEL